MNSQRLEFLVCISPHVIVVEHNRGDFLTAKRCQTHKIRSRELNLCLAPMDTQTSRERDRRMRKKQQRAENSSRMKFFSVTSQRFRFCNWQCKLIWRGAEKSNWKSCLLVIVQADKITVSHARSTSVRGPFLQIECFICLRDYRTLSRCWIFIRLASLKFALSSFHEAFSKVESGGQWNGRHWKSPARQVPFRNWTQLAGGMKIEANLIDFQMNSRFIALLRSICIFTRFSSMFW